MQASPRKKQKLRKASKAAHKLGEKDEDFEVLLEEENEEEEEEEEEQEVAEPPVDDSDTATDGMPEFQETSDKWTCTLQITISQRLLISSLQTNSEAQVKILVGHGLFYLLPAGEFAFLPDVCPLYANQEVLQARGTLVHQSKNNQSFCCSSSSWHAELHCKGRSLHHLPAPFYYLILPLSKQVNFADDFPAIEGDGKEEYGGMKRGKRKRPQRSVERRRQYIPTEEEERKTNQYTSGRPVNSPYFAPQEYKVGSMISC